MVNNLKIKKGDTAVIITGKNKGSRGKVLTVIPSKNKIVVEGVNIVTKHKKPRNQRTPGGIIKQEAAFDLSNAMVLCPKCAKATRVAHKIENGNKVRVCKKCSAEL